MNAQITETPLAQRIAEIIAEHADAWDSTFDPREEHDIYNTVAGEIGEQLTAADVGELFTLHGDLTFALTRESIDIRRNPAGSPSIEAAAAGALEDYVGELNRIAAKHYGDATDTDAIHKLLR